MHWLSKQKKMHNFLFASEQMLTKNLKLQKNHKNKKQLTICLNRIQKG